MFSDHNGTKLEINNRNTTETSLSTWKLNNTLLTKQLLREEAWKEIEAYTEVSKIKYNILQLWEASATMPRGKYIALNIFINKEKRSQVNN